MVYVCGCRDMQTSYKLQSVPFQKTDVLLMVGGLNTWWTSQAWKEWIAFLKALKCPILFLDSNHENFDKLFSLPQKEKFGGQVGLFDEDMYYLKRGAIYSIQDKTFFVFGGAESTYKRYNQNNKMWWPEECPTDIDFELAKETLQEKDYKINVVLSHTLPAQVWDRFRMGVPGKAARMLAFFYSRLTFDQWYASTYKTDQKILRVHSVYTDVVAIL